MRISYAPKAGEDPSALMAHLSSPAVGAVSLVRESEIPELPVGIHVDLYDDATAEDVAAVKSAAAARGLVVSAETQGTYVRRKQT